MARPSAAGQVAQACAIVLNLTLVAVAVWLWARLLQGGLTRPMSLPHALVVSMISAAVAAVVRLCWFSLVDVPASRCDPLFRWGPTAALAAIALALSLPGTPLQTLLILWGLGGVEEFVVARLFRSKVAWTAEEEDHAETSTRPGVELELLPEGTTQRLTRGRNRAGQDSLVGLLRVRFAPQQRNETLHVAFCPPFERVPDVQCRQVSGPTARIKTTQVLPHGLRLELKLDAARDEEALATVEVTAVGTA